MLLRNAVGRVAAASGRGMADGDVPGSHLAAYFPGHTLQIGLQWAGEPVGLWKCTSAGQWLSVLGWA